MMMNRWSGTVGSVMLGLRILISPTAAETFEAKGTVTAYSEVMRPGEDCETGAADQCKPGAPCFARIVIDGEAARTLYEAMKLHAPKWSEVSDSSYRGTKTDAMTCWDMGDGTYSCDIGYDAITNVLSETKGCRFE